jgi:hypothetical protein
MRVPAFAVPVAVVVVSWFVALAACSTSGGGVRGSGTSKTDVRDVPAFGKLELSGALRAEITVGGAQRVELVGDDNIVPLIETAVDGGTLRVGAKQSISPKLELVVRVTVPALSAVTTSGAVRTDVRGVAGDRFELVTSGAANVTAAGTTKDLRIESSGAGEVDAVALKAEHVGVVVSGAGDVDVHAVKSIDARIAGAGTVRYAGDPPDVRKAVSGAGTLKPR